MTTPNINLKKEAFDQDLFFEDIEGGDTLHNNVKASKATIARAKAGLKLFSLGVL